MKKEIFDYYLTEICSRFNLSKDELLSETKNRNITNARYFLYWMCKNRNMSIANIQQYMLEHGYKIAHSTIIVGIKRTEDKSLTDKDYITISRSIERGI